MASSNSISDHLFRLDVYLYERNLQAATKELNTIIDYLQKNKTDDITKKALVLHIIKRINVNYELEHYQEVLNDFQMLSDLGENPKKTKGLFLIKEKATMKILFDETNRRFAQAVLEFIDFWSSSGNDHQNASKTKDFSSGKGMNFNRSLAQLIFC
ncbi:unnamed protein product [Rotaria magnacalcarata]|uniref:Uncharacterized protein n=2 Tax=Rotaria magnacalcarata TaxID=392030 RepID=A0A814MWF1_9BILA|nr:unnamed protein product [Rotaria magnacalcarata]CAF4130955.1 unnamed protein product [Rotaria magnacalcarata]